MAARFFREFADRQPAVVVSFFIGFTGVGSVIVIPPIRRRLGYPTDQIDGFAQWHTEKDLGNEYIFAKD